MSPPDPRKAAAAERAVADYVRDGMRLGLGTGSTAALVLEALAARIGAGDLRDVAGVPTSTETAAACRRLGIPLHTLAECAELDVVIDGADEIDPHLNLIKGLGGAHVREKVVACAGRLMVVVADDSKLVPRLGERAPLPVEVLEFALPVCDRLLRRRGWEPSRRPAPGGGPFVTDEGNAILDCRRGDWSDPAALARAVDELPGVVGHGFFLGIAAAAVVGGADGVSVLRRGSHPAGAA